MKVTVRKGELKDSKAPVAVVGHYEDSSDLEGSARKLDTACGGLISEVITEGLFKGKLYETGLVDTRGLIRPKRVIIVGMGKKEDFDLDKLRGVYSKGAQTVRNLNMKEFASAIDPDIIELPLDRIAEAAVEGVMLGLYRFTPFKTVDRNNSKDIEELTIMEPDNARLGTIRRAVRVGKIISRAVYLARDLVATPSNEMTPTILAKRAREITKDRNITAAVTGEAAMKKLGMNALLGVARGSHEPPKLITLEYNVGKKRERPLVLVGKGITFDSGGISIKPAERMDEMKTDMSGGSAVIGTLMAAADLKLPLNLVGIIPATENLPGGRAYKPGDILRSMSGKTIEVINTDAEGRLILADAFVYANRYKPAALIDMATLTGACIVALGDLIIGMLGSDEKLKEAVQEASRMSGEKVWELPLYDDYNELLKSDVADIKNVGGRAGGAITAALFLQTFIADYPWVHLDIAGPAWLSKARPYIPKGASGIGVRLMVDFLRNWATNKTS